MAHHRAYKPEDWEEVVSMELAEDDKAEVIAAYGLPPRMVLALSLRDSFATWVIEHEGRIIGVFGVAHHDDHPQIVGVPWSLGTGEVSKCRYDFLRGSIDVVTLMLELFPVLCNLVDSRHKRAVRWLTWLGFEFEPQPYFLHDPSVPFLAFKMVRKEESSNV